MATWTDLGNDANNNVTCDAGKGTCADVRGRYISKAGMPVGLSFPIAAGPDNQIVSTVTFAGGKYLVVWNGGVTSDPEGELIGGDVFGMFIVPPGLACIGDCGSDHAVTVDELLTMIDIALGNADVSGCLAGDNNLDAQITVDEIITAINNALGGC